MINVLKHDAELWDLFTKREEYNPLFLDKYQRFSYDFSKHRDALEPKVSKFLTENSLKIEYPEGKKFAVCLTHDIDGIYFSKWEVILYAAKSPIPRQIQNALKIIFKNPLWQFKNIMRLEEKYGAKSSFYFLALDEDHVDFNYKIEDLENELAYIADKGWEVGLHGGYEAYNNLDEIQKEKQKLEKVLGRNLIGYRNHLLKFKVPDTWELLSKAGFKYDTTFGYVDMVGFRNGMCHPFKPFNLNRNEDIDILEIPLTIMDVTLFADRYMKLDIRKAWSITKLLIDTVKKYNGVITICWHNGISMAGQSLKFYEKILEYCHENNAWMTSGIEIWKFFNRK